MLIKGKRAIAECIKSQERLERVVVAGNTKIEKDLLILIKQNNVKVQTIPNAVFRTKYPDVRESIIGIGASIKHQSLDDILNNKDQYPAIVMLDHIQDPHNFGAILRSCEALGVRAVIYPKDRNSPLTETVIKVACGAVSHLSLIRVTNLANTVDLLKKSDYWIYGTDSDTGETLTQMSPNHPLVIIMGNEDKGLSEILRKKCDACIKINLRGRVASLNVSVATGIIVHNILNSKENNR